MALSCCPNGGRVNPSAIFSTCDAGTSERWGEVRSSLVLAHVAGSTAGRYRGSPARCARLRKRGSPRSGVRTGSTTRYAMPLDRSW
jgi:hypothetical protein